MCSRSVINFFNELLFNFIVGTFGIIIFKEKFSFSNYRSICVARELMTANQRASKPNLFSFDENWSSFESFINFRISSFISSGRASNLFL